MIRAPQTTDGKMDNRMTRPAHYAGPQTLRVPQIANPPADRRSRDPWRDPAGLLRGAIPSGTPRDPLRDGARSPAGRGKSREPGSPLAPFAATYVAPSPPEHATYMTLDPQHVKEYMNLTPSGDPRIAARDAALDRLWVDVAREYKILDGHPQRDHMLWEEHVAYTRGLRDRDPLEDDPRAVEEYKKRAMKLMMLGVEIGEDANGWESR